jgi:hypothetical protein
MRNVVGRDAAGLLSRTLGREQTSVSRARLGKPIRHPSHAEEPFATTQSPAHSVASPMSVFTSEDCYSQYISYVKQIGRPVQFKANRFNCTVTCVATYIMSSHECSILPVKEAPILVSNGEQRMHPAI